MLPQLVNECVTAPGLKDCCFYVRDQKLTDEGKVRMTVHWVNRCGTFDNPRPFFIFSGSGQAAINTYEFSVERVTRDFKILEGMVVSF